MGPCPDHPSSETKLSPHPSIEGRGSSASLTGMVEEGEDEGGVERWWREQTKINMMRLMFVSNSALPHR